MLARVGRDRVEAAALALLVSGAAAVAAESKGVSVGVRVLVSIPLVAGAGVRTRAHDCSHRESSAASERLIISGGLSLASVISCRSCAQRATRRSQSHFMECGAGRRHRGSMRHRRDPSPARHGHGTATTSFRGSRSRSDLRHAPRIRRSRHRATKRARPSTSIALHRLVDAAGAFARARGQHSLLPHQPRGADRVVRRRSCALRMVVSSSKGCSMSARAPAGAGSYSMKHSHPDRYVTIDLYRGQLSSGAPYRSVKIWT